jgi:hypothetical protein
MVVRLSGGETPHSARTRSGGQRRSKRTDHGAPSVDGEVTREAYGRISEGAATERTSVECATSGKPAEEQQTLPILKAIAEPGAGTDAGEPKPAPQRGSPYPQRL